MHRSRLTCALTTYRHTLRPGREDMYFIVASAFSISTLVKGPWTAPMQRAVALRSYFQSLRVRAVVISLLSSLLEGAPKPRLPAYEDSALCRAFDMTFSEEELHGVAVSDPADIERLRQICQRGGERLWLEHSAPPCAPQHQAHHPLTRHAPRFREPRAVA